MNKTKKIKLLLIFCFLAVVNSCASNAPFIQQIQYADLEVRKQTEGYINFFLSRLYLYNCKNSFWLKIEFSDEYRGLDILGRCEANFVKDLNGNLFIKGRVIFSKTHWEFLDDNKKRTLVSHELGHCILGADHNHGNVIMSEFLPILNWHEQHTINILDGLITSLCKR